LRTDGRGCPGTFGGRYGFQFSEQPPIMQQLELPQLAGAAALLFVLTENVESWGSSLRV
jgi:hypothetical protein